MLSGALGDETVLEEDEEHELSAGELSTALMAKALTAKEGNVPVSEQYRIRYQEQLQILEEGGELQLSDLLLPEYEASSSSDKEE